MISLLFLHIFIQLEQPAQYVAQNTTRNQPNCESHEKRNLMNVFISSQDILVLLLMCKPGPTRIVLLHDEKKKQKMKQKGGLTILHEKCIFESHGKLQIFPSFF